MCKFTIPFIMLIYFALMLNQPLQFVYENMKADKMKRVTFIY